MNNEQAPINFDDTKEINLNHEVFTNLPNNTLNGVNPMGVDENKTDVMDNLVTNVNAAVENGPVVTEAPASAPEALIEAKPIITEDPNIETKPTPAEEPKEESVVSQEANANPEMGASAQNVEMPATEKNVMNEIAPVENEVTSAVTPTIEAAPIVDTVINEEVNEPVKMEAQETIPTTSDKDKKKVRIIVFIAVLAVAIGGLFLFLYLILPKITTPAGATSDNSTSGSATVSKSEYVTASLSDFKDTYSTDEITSVTETNVAKKLSNGEKDVFNIMSNGTISFIYENDATKYEPLVFQGNSIKYFYSFYKADMYYFVATDGSVYEVKFNKTTTGYIDVTSVSVTLSGANTSSVSAKKNSDDTYTVQIKGNDETPAEITNVLGVDTTITKL